MKLSAREDIEAPAQHVFAALTDFEGFERGALRRGAEIRRLDQHPAPGPGMSWELRFRWRGRQRVVIADLVRWEPPAAVGWRAESSGYDLDLGFSLVELSPRRTRLTVEIEARPRTLAARILLQSMKLGKAKLTRKMQQRLRQAADELEERWRAEGAA
ncbi:SRPBCC family protein [Frigidibacter oleivorans]|uniref:SRPBCC family protein n=1 Tax=Frigidibacter oleivorans TaxID=2487129 RepID=UPI000F8DF11C|nr:SRPBCC family protein [Frigidibacter oleivorans]